MKARFQSSRLFRFCRMAGASLLGSTKSIPTGIVLAVTPIFSEIFSDTFSEIVFAEKKELALMLMEFQLSTTDNLKFVSYFARFSLPLHPKALRAVTFQG